MRYIYACATCEARALKKFKAKLITVGDSKVLPADIYEAEVLFETSHGIKPSQAELLEAIKCPRCGKTDCQKSFHGYQVEGYIRGYGWLDRAGAHRDMNMFHLTEKDPYAEYRTNGEVDHIKSQLRKAGKHNPKPIYSIAKGETKKPKKK